MTLKEYIRVAFLCPKFILVLLGLNLELIVIKGFNCLSVQSIVVKTTFDYPLHNHLLSDICQANVAMTERYCHSYLVQKLLQLVNKLALSAIQSGYFYQTVHLLLRIVYLV